MEKVFDTLYTEDSKSNVRSWILSVVQNDDGTAAIKRTYGTEGGKQTSTETVVKSGKNIGKKNETTPWEQAIKQAQSLYDKQLTMGYHPNKRDVIKQIKPMLAHGYDKNKEKHVKEPFYVQPKLDGVRMLVGKHLDGTKVVMSRTGKEMRNMEHVTDELFERISDGEFVDGENFTFDMTFEDITGICRTMIAGEEKHKKSKAIRFHAFDTFHLKHMDTPFEARYERLRRLVDGLKNTHVVRTELMRSKEHVPEKLAKYLEEGYEGLMMRNAHGTYKLDARSNDLLKAKQFVTEEYRIVAFSEAEGRDAGTVIWECESKNGTFHVRPRGSLEYRRKCFDDGNSYIGKMLTVQYQNLTDNGMPRFPVGIAVRDYE